MAFFFFHCTCRHALVTYVPYRRFKRPVDSCCCYSCCFHCNCTLQLYACFFKKSKGSMVTYVPDWRLKWPVDSCCCYCCCFHCSCTHVSLQRERAKRWLVPPQLLGWLCWYPGWACLNKVDTLPRWWRFTVIPWEAGSLWIPCNWSTGLWMLSAAQDSKSWRWLCRVV